MQTHRGAMAPLFPIALVAGILFTALAAMKRGTLADELDDLTMRTSAGDSVSLRSIRDARGTVFIFLEETCPICRSYSLTMRDLAERFTPAGIRFYGVFPNSLSSPDSVASFQKAYGLPFTMLMDREQRLTPLLGAHVTPEAVVLAPDGATLYRGRIDNLFYALGRRRGVVTEHDLRDILQGIVDGKLPPMRTTRALGCYISTPPGATSDR